MSNVPSYRRNQNVPGAIKQDIAAIFREALEAQAESDKPINVTINIQVNYADGGGATVNVK